MKSQPEAVLPPLTPGKSPTFPSCPTMVNVFTARGCPALEPSRWAGLAGAAGAQATRNASVSSPSGVARERSFIAFIEHLVFRLDDIPFRDVPGRADSRSRIALDTND